MATTILIVCPECGKQIKAPDNVIGKKVRCKFCQASFVASKGSGKPPAGKPAKPAAGKAAKPPAGKPAKPSKPAVDDDEEDENPYGMREVSLSARCPHCANEMEDEDAIICLNCGYNTRTRELGKVVKTYDNTAGDQFMWLLPGIVCILVIIGTIIFDIWYLMKIEDVVDMDAWWGALLAHGGIKLWVVIMSLFIIFFTGRFAIKRLIIHYSKPEVEKLK